MEDWFQWNVARICESWRGKIYVPLVCLEVIQGDAEQIIQSLEGPFDLILQDSDKALYTKLLETCIGLVRLHGVLVADDALFKPRGIAEKFSDPIHQHNQMVFSDPQSDQHHSADWGWDGYQYQAARLIDSKKRAQLLFQS